MLRMTPFSTFNQQAVEATGLILTVFDISDVCRHKTWVMASSPNFGIARVNLADVLLDGFAELDRFGSDASGDSQRQNQGRGGSLH